MLFLQAFHGLQLQQKMCFGAPLPPPPGGALFSRSAAAAAAAPAGTVSNRMMECSAFGSAPPPPPAFGLRIQQQQQLPRQSMQSFSFGGGARSMAMPQQQQQQQQQKQKPQALAGGFSGFDSASFGGGGAQARGQRLQLFGETDGLVPMSGLTSGDSSSSTLMALIGLQRASGAFAWGDPLEKVLKLKKEEALTKKPEGVLEEAWLTALAVTYMEATEEHEEDLWSLVVEKARRFVERNVTEEGEIKRMWEEAKKIVEEIK